MWSHVNYPRRCDIVSNGLSSWYAFRLRQVGIEFSSHNDLGPVISIPDGLSAVLYGQVVAGGDTIPHDIPLPPPRHHLEADDVWAVDSDLFNGEELRLAVENYDAAAVITRHLRHHHPKSAGFLHVNSVGDFCLL